MLDDQGMSVIHYACSHGSLHVLWLMVRNGADLTQENEVVSFFSFLFLFPFFFFFLFVSLCFC